MKIFFSTKVSKGFPMDENKSIFDSPPLISLMVDPLADCVISDFYFS